MILKNLKVQTCTYLFFFFLWQGRYRSGMDILTGCFENKPAPICIFMQVLVPLTRHLKILHRVLTTDYNYSYMYLFKEQYIQCYQCLNFCQYFYRNLPVFLNEPAMTVLIFIYKCLLNIVHHTYLIMSLCTYPLQRHH